jgi:hypothetical protein
MSSDSPFAGTYPKPQSAEVKGDTASLTPHLRNGHARTFYKGPRFFVTGPTPLACDACVWGRGEHALWCGYGPNRWQEVTPVADLFPGRLPK